MTFLGLLNWIVAFFVRAACGLLLTAMVPFLLVGLAFRWFDVGGADWAFEVLELVDGDLRSSRWFDHRRVFEGIGLVRRRGELGNSRQADTEQQGGGEQPGLRGESRAFHKGSTHSYQF